MGDELSPLQQTKDINIIRVIALISQGHTKEAACRKQNISQSTFDRATKDRPDIADEFFAAQKDQLTEMFTSIMDGRKDSIQILIDTEPETIGEAIRKDKRLKELQEEFGQELGLVAGPGFKPVKSPEEKGEEAAQAFLAQIQGPKLHDSKSKTTISQKETTIVIEEIGDEVDPEMVIDIEATEGS